MCHAQPDKILRVSIKTVLLYSETTSKYYAKIVMATRQNGINAAEMLYVRYFKGVHVHA